MSDFRKPLKNVFFTKYPLLKIYFRMCARVIAFRGYQFCSIWSSIFRDMDILVICKNPENGLSEKQV